MAKMNQALNYALRLLAKKDYTEAEIKQKFQKRQIDKEEAENAILFLKDKDFINDKRYAQNYAKIHSSRGNIRLKFELLKKGILEEDISSVLLRIGNSEQKGEALIVAQKWLDRKGKNYPDKNKLKQNLMSKLSRQGFSYEIIKEVISELNI